MTSGQAMRVVMSAVTIGGMAMVAACGAAPSDQEAAIDQSVTSCGPGYVQSCTYDDEMMKNVCKCVKPKELDSCTPDTDPSHDTSKTWLANAGCVSLTGHVVAAINPSGGGYGAMPMSPVTMWTCSQPAAIPAGTPQIFGGYGKPCVGGPGGCGGAIEHVVIMEPNNPQLPACMWIPAQRSGRCSIKTLSSSCYHDPDPDQFVVAQWYEYFSGAAPSPCSGAACMCVALCGLVGD